MRVSSLVLLTLTLSACGNIDPESLKGGELRDTMSPRFFTGKTKKSYKIAKEIPEILDSLYCYCDCKKKHGHKSLLTCYVDTHAKYCAVCMNEAISAMKLHKEGKDVVAIRKYIDKKYSKRRH